MKAAFILGGVLALGFASLGCANTDDDGGEIDLELLTWWSQDSELDAIQAVIDVNAVEHPRVHVRVLTADTQQSMAVDIANRLTDGTPPTAFQANLGGNALQWQESAEPLDARAKGWASAFQDSILERVSADGKLLAVPIALTRQNNVYYNLELLKQLELDIPEGLAEFDAWLAALSAQGYTHPLCIGDQHNWVSAHALFEDIVPAYIGAEHSQKFWSGQLRPDDPLFSEALDYAATLNRYWNTDFDKIDWNEGLERLLEMKDDPAEQCLMTPMGDWGGAVLAGRHTVDKDFVQRAWPGAEQLFVMAGDAFITARGVKNQGAALDLFDTLASEAGQIAFNAKKGSVPARTLADPQRSDFGPLTLANMADLANGTPVPAYKVLGSSDFPWDALAVLVHDFVLVGDKQPIVALLTKHYQELAPPPR